MRVHLVYPHGNRISAPDSIGRELGRRLEKLYTVIYHDWSDRDVIRPEPGDVLLGHPHPDPGSVFRRSLKVDGWRRRLMMAPFSHADLRHVAFVDPLMQDCDLFLSITGPYWFSSLGRSRCSHWQPKMIRLDLAIDRKDYPPVKTSFAPPGKRRVAYIGHTAPYKNTPYLSEIAALLPDTQIAWIGSGHRPIPGLTALGPVDFSSEAGKDLIAQFDLLLTVGTADPNPTTILEAMAWGLVPVCTPTSGYEGIPSIPNVPLGDAAAAASIVRRLLQTDESDLTLMRTANWLLLDRQYSWDHFAAQVVDAIVSTASPPLLRESLQRRFVFAFYNVISPHGPVAQRQPGRTLLSLRRRYRASRVKAGSRTLANDSSDEPESKTP